MIPYCQYDNAWAKHKIGKSDLTIGGFGCYLTALSILDGRDPLEINDLLTEQGGYTSSGLIISYQAARILGFEWRGVARKAPNYDCICETDYFQKHGYSQHFFARKTDGKIIDPLDGETKDNPYHIVTYRLFWRDKNG